MSYNPVIVVVAHARYASLSTLLMSLDAADYGGRDVTLVISVDDAAANPTTVAVADAFNWTYGNKILVKRDSRLGLKEHVLKCSDMSVTYGSAIVLEDDVAVSPLFYRYTCGALDAYGDDDRIGQVALYRRQQLNFGRTGKHPENYRVACDDGSSVHFHCVISTWGQAYTASMWRGFREWYASGSYDATQSGTVPGFITTYGKSPDMWSNLFITYLAATGRYTVWPNVALSTNMDTPGIHGKFPVSMQVPLLYSQQGEFIFTPLDDSVAVYDIYHGNRLLGKVLSERFDIRPPAQDLVYGDRPYKPDDCVLTRAQLSGRPLLGSWMDKLQPVEINVLMNMPGQAIRLYGPA